MTAKIGSLNVDVELRTARLRKGAKDAQGVFAKLGRNIAGIGAAVAGAMVGIDRLFDDLATKAKGMDNAARLAGSGFEEFQRKAHAAKSVGIEYEKLGDIFKDTRDKIGDFIATGGGEMADFFEKIGPKVGVTAEQFKKLSGAEGLQLYYNSLKKAGLSQNEIVFYMESIADEASALIPLLEKNGAAFDKLGGKAAVITEEQLAKLKRYNEAQLQMEAALQRVTLALVDSGIIETFADLAEKVGALAEGFTGVEKAAGATDAELRKTEGARRFGEQLRSANDSIQNFVDAIDAINAARAARTREFWSNIGQGIAGTIAYFDSLAVKAVESMQRLYAGVRTWLQGKLGAVFDWVNNKIKSVERTFFWLADQVVFNSHIPDMVTMIGQHMAKLDKLMVDPAVAAAQKTEDAFRELAANVSGLLDRLFPQAASLKALRDDLATIDAGEKAGQISPEIAAEARFRLRREQRGDYGYELPENMEVGPLGNAEPIDGKPIVTDLDRAIAKAREFSDMVRGIAANAFAELGHQIEGVIVGAQSFGDALKNLAARLASMLIDSAWSNLGSAIGIPGFARGTRNAPPGWHWVGEEGPELLRFRGGEQVMPADASSRFSSMIGSYFTPEKIAATNAYLGRLYSPEFPLLPLDGLNYQPQLIGGPSARAISVANDSGDVRGGDSHHTWQVKLHDAEGFKRSQRQLERQMRRRMR